MAGSRFWGYLHSRSEPSDSRLSSQPKVPIQPSRAVWTRWVTPYGVMDLFRRGHLLGPTLCCPGLAAFDPNNPKRCGRSEGLKTRAHKVAGRWLSSVARCGHLHRKMRTAESLRCLTFRGSLGHLRSCYRATSRRMSANHASAIGVPRPGLMSKRSGVSDSMLQPEPNAARSSPSVTRRGPQSPG